MEIIKHGYTRVSDILGRLRDKSGIDPHVLETKGKIGTEVHEKITLEKQGDIPIFRESFDDWPEFDRYGQVTRWSKRGFGYFVSFCEWDKVYRPVYSLMEKRFYDDEFMITGQIDAVVKLKDKDDLYLIDYKCSHSPDLEMWNMQAHFYWYILKQNGVDVADNFIWIQLKKDGKIPSTFSFVFDENVLSRCFEEAEKYFNDMQEAKSLD